MKSVRLGILLGFPALLIFGDSQEEIAAGEPTQSRQDVIRRAQQKQTAPKKGKKAAATESYPQHDHRIYIGIPAGYEYLHPDGVYFGVEGYRYWKWNMGGFEKNFFLSEARIGYHFYFSKVEHFIPTFSLGYLQDFRFRHNHNHKMVYQALGFRYYHEFDTIFNLGLNLNLLIGYKIGNRHKHHWRSPIIGWKAEVPFTFIYGGHRNFDLVIEPFGMEFYDHHKKHDYGGILLSAGYRF